MPENGSCVCVFVRVFLGHFEIDWDPLWHKVAFYPWGGSKTYFKKCSLKRVIAIFLYLLHLNQLTLIMQLMKPSIKKYFCVKTPTASKSSFVPKGYPIDFEMAEKNANSQTHTQTHTQMFISTTLVIHNINKSCKRAKYGILSTDVTKPLEKEKDIGQFE